MEVKDRPTWKQMGYLERLMADARAYSQLEEIRKRNIEGELTKTEVSKLIAEYRELTRPWWVERKKK